MLRKFFNDEAGFVLSAEMIIIATLTIGAAVIGAAAVRDSIVNEYDDVADSIGALDQSWRIRDVVVDGDGASNFDSAQDHGGASGSGFNDNRDDCDCKGVDFLSVCGHDGKGTGSESGSNVP